MLHDVVALRLVDAAIGLHVGQNGLLAQVVADDLGDVGIDHLVVGDAGARRIGERDLALLPGAQQAGDTERRVGIEGLGIQEHVVDASIDHVHPRQAVDGAHIDAVVLVDDEVAALHQFRAHLLCEIGVFEVGRIVDTGREDHDLRILDATRSDRDQHIVEL